MAPESQLRKKSVSITCSRTQAWLVCLVFPYRFGRERGDFLCAPFICLPNKKSFMSVLSYLQASPDPNVIGGICETRLSNALSLNVGFSTTQGAAGAIVPSFQTILSASHEIVHSLGKRIPTIRRACPHSISILTMWCFYLDVVLSLSEISQHSLFRHPSSNYQFGIDRCWSRL